MRNFIFGAGGHGRVVREILRASGVEVAAFIDAERRIVAVDGLQVISESELPKKEEIGIIVAVGSNFIRRAILARLATLPKIFFINAVHPSAIVASDAKMGVGNVIAAGAIVGSGAIIGNHCVINSGAQADHDCLLADFVSLAPACILGGNVNVGTASYIGLGAIVIHGITIGAHSVVGAGSVVIDSVEDFSVAFGNPCRKVRNRKEDDAYL